MNTFQLTQKRVPKMNRKAVAPAILLIGDEPDSNQKVFVDELSNLYGIVTTFTQGEIVSERGSGYLAVFLVDLLSQFGCQVLSMPVNARYILVVVTEPDEIRANDGALVLSGSTKNELIAKPIAKDLGCQDEQHPKTYFPVRFPEEKAMENFRCQKFSALFAYAPKSLRLISAQSGLLTYLEADSLQELQYRIPNYLHLLNEKAGAYFEDALAKAQIRQEKILIRLLIQNQKSSGFSQMQLAFTPIPYPSSEGTFFLMEIAKSERIATTVRKKISEEEVGHILGREEFYDKAGALFAEKERGPFLYVRWQILQFTYYTEHYGQEKGDRLLLQCASFLNQWLADLGYFAHLYSDHFAFVVSEEAFDPELFLNESNQALDFAKTYFDVSTALGIARVADCSVPMQHINKMAKLALCSVINEHDKSGFAFFEARKGEETLRSQRLLEEIPSALKTHQIEIYLQPVFNLKEQKFVSAEVLARWVHPTLGLLAPKVFIPLFEQRKMVLDLDLCVLESVCTLQQSLIEEGIAPLPVSINLSQLDFYSITLSETIQAIVDSHCLAHGLICFEVTESTYMDNQKQLMKTLGLLKEQGFLLLLDDFGSGYSSLRFLTSFPIDTLKIDMEFTQQIGLSSKVETALQTVATMAKNLGIEMIAEGVETKSQSDFFQSIGCNQIQGYLYAKPMSSQSYRLFLESMQRTLPKVYVQ
jgi:EAL domain-containing protein (putative c-di-GMP-specific phosphodiesterase class I)/GGDEF domain-containing protein